MSADAPNEIRLAPPGAGLPLPELWIARLRLARYRKRSRDDLDAILESERAKVLALAKSVPAETAGRQVLIRRLRGLEDSSRNWSVFMTVDHLHIVNLAVAGVVRALARGECPPGEVSTAEVKPEPGVGEGVVDEFDRCCEILATTFAKIDDLHTAERHPHPWFGPLDAAGWHALSAMHTRLHRGQIERILTALR